MNKKVKLWKKQEKRIVKLAYRAGLLKLPLKDLHWIKEPSLQMCYWNKNYLGEGEQYPLVLSIHSYFFYAHVTGLFDKNGNVESTYTCRTSKQAIKFLSKFPRKIFDSKINKVLKVNIKGE